LLSKLVTLIPSANEISKKNGTDTSTARERYIGYNIVQIEGCPEIYIVDLLYDPGNLYLESSPLASQYIKVLFFTSLPLSIYIDMFCCIDFFEMRK
jgi:hypothetical protein